MNHSILIVDDSKLARMSVAKLLAALRPDWSRFEASSADGALELLKTETIDLALIDFNMPGLDGVALVTEIKSLKARMPVAIVSANHQTEVLGRAERAGAAFLIKPLTSQALGAFLEDAELQLKEAGE